MLIKSLLKKCETGFDLVIVADSVSGHTMEFSSVKDAQIVAGGDQIISWEVGIEVDIGEANGNAFVTRKWVLYITI